MKSAHVKEFKEDFSFRWRWWHNNALVAIGTPEAISVIKECTTSNDSVFVNRASIVLANSVHTMNNLDQQDLWNKIATLQIGPANAPLSFNKRLARENSWRIAFADRVIFEYKRFIFLAATSKEEVTPSDQIDQAWHLHLTYTKSYWKDLCEELLGFELHHSPTLGGGEEQFRFKQQYSRTLALYKQVYGENPPEDVWPTVDERFEAVEEFVRINKKKAWIIKKPHPVTEKLVLIVALSMLLVACADYLSDKDIWFWLKTAFGVYIVYKVLRWLGAAGGGGSSGGGSGCGGCGGCGGCSD